MEFLIFFNSFFGKFIVNSICELKLNILDLNQI